VTTRIVITEKMDLLPAQWERLHAIDPNPSIYNYATRSAQEWHGRCEGHEIVCSGKTGMTSPMSDNPLDLAVYHLETGTRVFYPFTTVANVNRDLLRAAGVTFAYAPGSNKHAVAEWVVLMMLALGRQFTSVVNQLDATVEIPRLKGLAGNRATILGMGNVGWEVATRLAPMGMRIATYTSLFQRLMPANERLERSLGVEFEGFYGEADLYNCVREADFVINCLSRKLGNEGMLNRKFFDAIKQGAFFLSMANPEIWDMGALEDVLDSGHLAGAGIDVGDRAPADVTHENYVRMANHPRILATAQTAHYTDHTQVVGYGMMLKSMEASIRGVEIPYLWA